MMRRFSPPLTRYALVCIIVPIGLLAQGFPTFPTYRVAFPQVAGDFNGDGKVDLVNIGESTISIALGRGNGFGLPITSAIPYPPQGYPVAGDFNGDHKLDIAFLSINEIPGVSFVQAVTVALGNGDGTFGSVLNLPVPFADLLLAGDVNGDGKPDLVLGVVGSLPHKLQIYLGSGDGTFQASGTPFPGLSCALVDINGDGKLDLLGNGVRLGNGNGTFQAPIPMPGGFCPAIADFNGDGKLDIALLGDKGLIVYFGNGDGTVQAGITYSGGLNATAVRVGDFNGDGKPDLFLSDGTIFLNAGAGTFRPSVRYQFPGALLADVNRDGRSDVIFGAVRYPGISVAFAQPDGTFIAPHAYAEPLDGNSPASVTMGDFTGDGKIDLAVCGTLEGHIAGQWARLNGKVNGTFGPAISGLTGGKNSRFIAAADFNHDGKLDIVTVSSDSINVLLGLGGGKLQPPVNYPATSSFPPTSPSMLAIADFNGDGIPDIAVNGNPGQMLLGNGDGTFRNGPSLPAGIHTLLAGDVDGDGKTDLVVLLPNGIGIMLGNGNGSFKAPSSFHRSRVGGTLVAADFNNDGKIDVAEVSPSPVGTTIRIFLSHGDGSLMTPTSAWISRSPPGGIGAAVAADFDGDGNMDLAVAVVGGIAVKSGNGAGSMGSTTSFYVTQTSFGVPSLLATDFDGNGTQDLAVFDPVVNTIAILLNQ